MKLAGFAGWPPWEVKKMTVRERKFWVRWYDAIEERKVMEDVTPTTTYRQVTMG